MGISRRHFLEVSSLAAAACAVPLESIGEQVQRNAEMGRGGEEVVTPGRTPMPVMNRTMSESTFRSLVNHQFTLTLKNGSKAVATLVGVENPDANLVTAAANPRFKRTQSFLLRFHLNQGMSSLKQGTYNVSNPSMGKFSLFIVPFSTTGTNTSFTATISNPPA